MKTLSDVYQDHAEMPFISEQYKEELILKPIPKRNMVRTAEGFLPGHIILLWRIQFGTYRTDSPHHKYFATSYGIDAEKELQLLIKEGYVRVESAMESLRHLSAGQVKLFLGTKAIKGLSKLKRQELDQVLLANFSQAELEDLFSVRGYLLTDKGKELLERHPDIIDKHPKKKF
ncbi:hypothetical protein [Streptococcus ferus]|uniref:hypothetical protein n=1 Tax=Streptococcus ferus TaxID=1345 RepID=UPI0035A058AD